MASGNGIDGWRVVYNIGFTDITWGGFDTYLEGVVSAGYNCLIIGQFNPGAATQTPKGGQPEQNWGPLNSWIDQLSGGEKWTLPRSDLKVLFGVFGDFTTSTYWHTGYLNQDPTILGTEVGKLAAVNQFDGFDFYIGGGPQKDGVWEGCWNQSTGTGATDWFNKLVAASYNSYNENNANNANTPPIITFSLNPLLFTSWASTKNGFCEVEKGTLGQYISWYNMQYNYGGPCWTTDATILTSTPLCPGSISELASNGIPKTKIIIGKLLPTPDTTPPVTISGNLYNAFYTASNLTKEDYNGIMGFGYDPSNAVATSSRTLWGDPKATFSTTIPTLTNPSITTLTAPRCTPLTISNVTKSNVTKSNVTKSNVTKSNVTKSNVTKSNGSKSNDILTTIMNWIKKNLYLVIFIVVFIIIGIILIIVA